MMEDLQLIWTNPCAENWDDMQETVAGKYCDRCEKNIVDLTTKSDAELIKFFKKKEDNVCGRLLSSQLYRKLTPAPPKNNWHWLMTVAIGASVASPALAQKQPPVTVQRDSSVALRSPSIDSAVKSSILKDGINGKVIAHGNSKKDTALNERLVDKSAGGPFIRVGGVSAVSLDKRPLLVVYAGKKSCTMDASRMNEFSPEWIEELKILKDEESISTYGPKAVNGVIIIRIKEAHAAKIDFSAEKKI